MYNKAKPQGKRLTVDEGKTLFYLRNTDYNRMVQAQDRLVASGMVKKLEDYIPSRSSSPLRELIGGQWRTDVNTYKQKPVAKAVGDFFINGTNADLTASANGGYVNNKELGAPHQFPGSLRGTQDTIMGNLVVDSIRDFLNSKGLKVDGVIEELWPEVVFIDGQDINQGMVFDLMLYENLMVVMEITPAELKYWLEDNANHFGGSFMGHISGFKVEYNMFNPQGSRVLSVTMDGENAPLDLSNTTRKLHIVTDTQDVGGGCGFFNLVELFDAGKGEITPYWNRDTVMGSMAAKGTIRADDYKNRRQTFNILETDNLKLNVRQTAALPKAWNGFIRDGASNTVVNIRETDANGNASSASLLTISGNSVTGNRAGRTWLTWDFDVKMMSLVTNFHQALFSITIPVDIQ